MPLQDEMPTEPGLDNTLKLLREGYEYIINRREAMDTNVFATRLLGENAICLHGREAARLFYDESKFKRAGAAPLPLKKTLFGEQGVQTLDGEAHRHRKALFMSLWTEDAVKDVRALTRKHLTRAAAEWEGKDNIILYDEAKMLLTRMVCEWAGVPLEASEVAERASQLGDMYESAATVGLGHFKGWLSRSNAEDWIGQHIRAVRQGELAVDDDKALYRIAHHRDLDGELLDEQVAAVEVLNVLRPTVANAVYIALLARAVHDHPEQVEALTDGDETRLRCFVQETRRFYPFFPFVAARVKKTFSWEGHEFEEDTLTLLDLYGTNRSPNDWDQPNQFKPERFADWDGSPFNFIPQGGGDYTTGHRCAGEWITLAVMTESLEMLVNRLRYELPPQDMSFSLADVPAIPRSGFTMSQVHLRL